MESHADKARRLGVPLIGGPAETTPRPRGINPVVAVCGQCGLEISEVMGYCCPNAGCPTGLGGVQS